MKKIDKIINIIRENMVSSALPTNNISSGEIATFDPLLKFRRNKNNTIDFRRVPKPYRKWIKNK